MSLEFSLHCVWSGQALFNVSFFVGYLSSGHSTPLIPFAAMGIGYVGPYHLREMVLYKGIRVHVSALTFAGSNFEPIAVSVCCMFILGHYKVLQLAILLVFLDPCFLVSRPLIVYN